MSIIVGFSFCLAILSFIIACATCLQSTKLEKQLHKLAKAMLTDKSTDIPEMVRREVKRTLN